MTRMTHWFVLTAVAFGFLTARAAHAGPILEFNRATTFEFFFDNFSAGWSFTTNQAIEVGALDAFFVDAGGSKVRLYDGSRAVLASAIVLPTDPLEGSPTPFHSHAINPVALAAHTTYFIAEDFSNSITAVDFNVGGLTTGPSITYGFGVAGLGKGHQPTTDVFSGILNRSYFGPNFDIVAAVPEPSSLISAATAASFGLAYAWRRRKRTAWRSEISGSSDGSARGA